MKKVLHICDHCGKEQVEPLHICGFDRKVEQLCFSVWHTYGYEAELCDECYTTLMEWLGKDKP